MEQWTIPFYHYYQKGKSPENERADPEQSTSPINGGSEKYRIKVHHLATSFVG